MVDLEGPIVYLISNGFDQFYATNHVDIQKRLNISRGSADLLLYNAETIFGYKVIETMSEDR